jgi:hypothetical protein
MRRLAIRVSEESVMLEVKSYPKPPFPAQSQSVPGSSEGMQPKPDYGEDSYVGANRLADKIALITGGDSGIGRAVALAFAREGADVVVSYLNEHEDARETQRLVEEAGRRCLLVPGDISQPDHCRALVRKTVDAFGHIDVLVNNAAYQMTFDSIEEIPDEEWDKRSRRTSPRCFTSPKRPCLTWSPAAAS